MTTFNSKRTLTGYRHKRTLAPNGDPFPPDTIIGDGIVNGYAFHPSIAGEGLHVIYAKYTGGGGCHSTDSIYVLVVNCTSNHQINFSPSVYLTPNPFSAVSFFHYPEQLYPEGGELTIFNQLGSIVSTEEVTSSPHLINRDRLDNGIYHYRFNGATVIFDGSFLIQ